MPRHVLDKWIKTKALLGSDTIRSHVPETMLMNAKNLKGLLVKHKMVYVKPRRGTFGIGVIRVDQEEGGYKFQLDKKVYLFSSFKEMYTKLLILKRKRPYLAQKGINLQLYRKRPFDIRVMAQTNPRGKWETTGIIGRVAAPKKIVTNFHNGGQLVPFETLVKACAGSSSVDKTTSKLAKLGVNVGKRMSERFPGVQEVGLDIGLDDKMKPWIIEVNTSPDPFIFLRLKDKSVFRKVRYFARKYGKT